MSEQSKPEFYAAYRDERAKCRPEKCTQGALCWVENGPPSYKKYMSSGFCVECNGPPLHWQPWMRRSAAIKDNNGISPPHAADAGQPSWRPE